MNALCYGALLSPMIRLLPHTAIMLAGRAAWLAPAAAAIGGGVWLMFVKAFFKNRNDGEGFAEMCQRSIGRPLTSALTGAVALWLIFYCGFLLRTFAERFLSTVYSHGNTPIFVAVTLLICMVAATGTVKSLARSAELFSLMINGIFAAVVIFSLVNVKGEHLLPVTAADAGNIALGALPITNIMGIYAYCTFLMRYVDKKPGEGREAFRWMLRLTVFSFFLIFITVGSCSAELAVGLQSPFFMMVRNVTILGFIDRIESVIIAIWVATDFLLLSFLYIIIGDIGRRLTGAKSRKTFVFPAGALSAVCAFAMADNAFDLQGLSEKVIPTVNMVFAFAVMPLIFIIGKARRKI